MGEGLQAFRNVWQPASGYASSVLVTKKNARQSRARGLQRIPDDQHSGCIVKMGSEMGSRIGLAESRGVDLAHGPVAAMRRNQRSEAGPSICRARYHPGG
jgi:hypothetical protein